MKTKTKLQAFGIFLAALAWLVPTVSAQSTDEPYTFSTLAGSPSAGTPDGTGIAAPFDQPHGLAVDTAGNVHVADSWNQTIRKVTPTGLIHDVPSLPWRARDGFFLYQWHYAGGPVTTRELKNLSKRTVAPVLFMAGTVKPFNRKEHFRKNPRNPAEPTPDRIWYKAKE